MKVKIGMLYLSRNDLVRRRIDVLIDAETTPYVYWNHNDNTIRHTIF